MNMHIRSISILAFLVLVVSCSSSAERVVEPTKGNPTNGSRIAWDYSSMVCISSKGGYARTIKLFDGSLVAVYEDYSGNVELKRSYDLGKTWGEPMRLFAKFSVSSSTGKVATVNIANPEIIQLNNGDLVVGCNYRPVEQEVAPYAIAIRRSSDLGQSWSDAQVLYEAAPRFADGCWEPAFLQLPNGELQVYFANENPYRSSSEQQISMLSSADNGVTWTKDARVVSYRAGKRDGMPVPLILNDEVVVSIEDNMIGEFKPYTVRTKLQAPWSDPVLAGSSNRCYALADVLPEAVYAGAPYIAKLASGETILSYQTTEGRSTDWEKSVMEVAIGDKSAYGFTKRSRPFDVPLSGEGKWNSVAVLSDQMVMALSSTNFRGGDVGVWAIKGRVIPPLVAAKGSIQVDGIVDQAEWGDDFPIFIGSKGSTNLQSAIRTDGKSLFFACKVSDKLIYDNGSDVQKADAVSWLIDPNSTLFTSLEKGMFRITVTASGIVKCYEARNGEWSEAKLVGLAAKAGKQAGGYLVEVAIPLQAIGMQGLQSVRLAMLLNAFDSAYVGYSESIASSSENQPNTWCEVTF